MKYNIENRIKDTAIVNLTDFENAIDLYEDGEIEKALELMFGATVLGFGGDFETDDREVRRLLRNREYTVVKSNEAFCNKLHSKEIGQRAKLQLDDIAEMMANGATQQIIADSLSVSLDTIKYRVRIMKEKFPSLYAESVKKCKKVGVSGSNVNDNDNVNEVLLLESTSINKKEEYDVDINTDCNSTSNQKEDKVEPKGNRIKEILDSFKNGDNTRFPTMDELRAIFIKENIKFTDEDFKNNSSGMINGKYKISPRNAAGAVNKYIRKPIIDYGFWYDSDNKDIQNAVISYIKKKNLNVVVGNNY